MTLADERYGKVHDYSPRRGIHASGILAPQAAPPWVLDRERLWNAVEAAEGERTPNSFENSILLSLINSTRTSGKNYSANSLSRKLRGGVLSPIGLFMRPILPATNATGMPTS